MGLAMRAYRAMFVRLGQAQWYSWLSIKLLVPIDRFCYRRSGGRFSLLHFGAGRAAAMPTLLLTTTGRKSGRQRTTPVLYLEDRAGIVVVGSNFGQSQHPSWSANLLANPHATVQIHTKRRDVTARLASEEEKAALWPRLLQLYPTWDTYTTRTDRRFRAFFLEPA
jgi:deazaflavin-dependent oxidoreductase (nitroreductase family)